MKFISGVSSQLDMSKGNKLGVSMLALLSELFTFGLLSKDFALEFELFVFTSLLDWETILFPGLLAFGVPDLVEGTVTLSSCIQYYNNL